MWRNILYVESENEAEHLLLLEEMLRDECEFWEEKKQPRQRHEDIEEELAGVQLTLESVEIGH